METIAFFLTPISHLLAPEDMLSTPEIFARIYRRHGHRCPMSTLGGRLGLAAIRHLGGDGESLAAIYYTRTCALDGIAVTTGCSQSDGRLRVEERGEHRLVLTCGDKRVEAALGPQALATAWHYRRASEALERERPELCGAERTGREKELERLLEEVLQVLWSRPEEDLLAVRSFPMRLAEQSGCPNR